MVVDEEPVMRGEQGKGSTAAAGHEQPMRTNSARLNAARMVDLWEGVNLDRRAGWGVVMTS